MEDVAAIVVWGIPGAIITSMAVGLLWSPIAAIICLLIARIRGLRGDGYGSAGFRYSLLFLLPWIYLALRMAGVPVPRMVERIGYALLYGVWAVLALVFIGGGPTMAWNTVLQIEDVDFSDHTLNEPFLFVVAGLTVVVAGLAIAVFWFVSLRRLLRRHVLRGLSRSNTNDDYKPSVPMRTAYVALNVLWVLGAVGAFAAGIANVVFRGPLCPSNAVIPVWLSGVMPFWTCAAGMALMWIWALKRFGFRTADSWDYPPSPTPNQLPPDDAYITPCAHFYRMIVIPAVVALALLVFSFILYLMGGGDMVNC